MRAKYTKDKKGGVTWDLSYWVDLQKLGDSRWSVPEKPPFQGLKEDNGAQFYATWSSGASADSPPAIKIIIQKMKQTEPKKTFNYEFKELGRNISVADVKKMHEAFYDEWIATART